MADDSFDSAEEISAEEVVDIPMADEPTPRARAKATAKAHLQDDDLPDAPYSIPNLSHVKNKMRREQMIAEHRKLKADDQKRRREKRKREEAELGDQAPPKQKPKTLDSMREADETFVLPGDEEIAEDTAVDEFASYFASQTTPKILITTGYTCTKVTRALIKDLLSVFPGASYYKRRRYELKLIIEYAKNQNFTDIMVLSEDHGKTNSLILCHLPHGPTAYFKIQSSTLRKDIEGHGAPTSHEPEVILNNFSTRLGHSIGRMLAALFPQAPNFRGRRVVTFHNQRDFVFLRHHRYIFDDDGKNARLQELGPQLTLKLQSLQHGSFDSFFGEYEWKPKKEHKPSRRKFFL